MDNKTDTGLPDWVLTYGDLMSLLLCFFVMLYAISTLQTSKMEAAVESFRGGFGKMPIAKQTGKPLNVAEGSRAKNQMLTIDEQTIQGGIIRFKPGSDELTDDAKQSLNALIDKLTDSPFKIQITGHAGTEEQGAYRDSMDLSYSRAVNVWRFFVSHGMNRHWFRITSVAAAEPVESSTLINTCVDIKYITNAVRKMEENTEKLEYLNF